MKKKRRRKSRPCWIMIATRDPWAYSWPVDALLLNFWWGFFSAPTGENP